jgi:probable HAF family extracellular repeat protein
MRTLSLLVAVLCFASIGRAQPYTVRAIDLDPAILTSWCTDVTSDGRVVGGFAYEGGRRSAGFVWRDGVIEQLVVPQPGNFSIRPRTLDIHHHVIVLAMTDAGVYAGIGSNVNFGHSSQPYFAWLPSSDPYPPQFVAADEIGSAFVLDIADTTPFITGVGVGTVRVGTATARKGFISSLSQTDDVGNPPRMILLNGFGGPLSPSAATAVNSARDVVGYAANAQGVHRAFVRRASGGVMTDLGTLGGPSGEADDISNAGHIVGNADVEPARPHAFSIAPGSTTMTDLGTLGGPASRAQGVNNQGDVVGESWTAEGLVHAFLWRDGVMIDLNSRIPADSGWTLVHAEAINDAGVIVGWGRYDGRTLGFVVEPAACSADFNGDKQLNSQDFFDFLAAFFAGSPSADFNTDGSTNSQDFFDFLGAFFGGC